MQLVKTDVFVFLEHYKEQFDLIFADPPYDLKNFEDVPPRLIFEKGLLRPDGIFILEHSKEYDFSEYLLFKEKRVYGSVNFSLFTPPIE